MTSSRGPATRAKDGPPRPTPQPTFADDEQAAPPPKSGSLPLMVAVLGVVYGDIGTSPIYALRECFHGPAAIAVTTPNVLGVLSLIVWSLLLIISLKYMVFVLSADNHGEGGIFALLALLRPWHDLDRRRRRLLILLGLFGASLLYGGVMITPSISILSAVEGIGIATPTFAGYVDPITVLILVSLFLLQPRGSAGVGRLFGPVIVVWLTTLAALGIGGILRSPGVLTAINPVYAVEFLVRNGHAGYVVLFAVFLVVTGGEALYADLGHFGRGPIRRTWFTFVLPALVINYLGQGGLLLSDPQSVVHPFYRLAPAWFLYPLVALATAATVIASQAAITGAFSLTRQAVQLGQFPPVRVLQTSQQARGQIYVPAMNWLLMAATIGLVLMFRTSSNLASAYGVAVNSTMVITTILAFRVARERGGWSLPAALAFLLGFLMVDLGFFGSNLLTLPRGGWFPILAGLLFFAVLSTWRRGSELMAGQLAKRSEPLEDLLAELHERKPVRVPGTAVFLTGRLAEAPPTLAHHLLRSKALHEQVILLTVIIENVPKVAPAERIEIKRYEQGFFRVILHYGFMQGPNIPSDLANCKDRGLTVDLEDTTYYIGHQTLVPTEKQRGMTGWRDKLFAFLVRNSMNPTRVYQVPSDRVVVMGLQVRI